LQTVDDVGWVSLNLNGHRDAATPHLSFLLVGTGLNKLLSMANLRQNPLKDEIGRSMESDPNFWLKRFVSISFPSPPLTSLLDLSQIE
jgi:hypothetical protein